MIFNTGLIFLKKVKALGSLKKFSVHLKSDFSLSFALPEILSIIRLYPNKVFLILNYFLKLFSIVEVLTSL